MWRTIGLIVLALVAAVGAWTWWSFRDVSLASLEKAHLGPDDRFVEIDGVRVRVREQGPESGERVVLLHGFSHSLETWDALSASLVAEGYRTIAFDLPGHGLSGFGPEARLSNEDTAMFVAAALDALEIEKPNLIGNSLGGLLAWRVAASEPDAVDKLVLIAPGGYSINGVTEKPVAVPGVVKSYLTLAPAPLVKAAYKNLFSDAGEADPAMIALNRAYLRREGVGEGLVARLEVFTLPDPTADLAKIAAPTLIVWGRDDRLIPSGHGAKFDEAIPDSTLKVYGSVGHVPQEETPERLAQDVIAFLSAAAP